MAAICWGVVMWLFETDKSTLQPSLRSSMDFLYKESNTVGSLKELIPFYPKAKAAKKEGEGSSKPGQSSNK
jgi:peroxisomal membrane protein 4